MMSKEKSVKERLLSNENIYLAIYSLNSSEINETLLDKDDLIKYLHLRDKFNQPLILEEIKAVRKVLKKIINRKNKYYFDTKVYLNPKSFIYSKPKNKTKEEICSNKDGNIEYKFRPLHTSSLVNQLAMISMLNILIYDIDDSNKISISEIGKLLPANFYGNRVSKKPERLFKPWVNQYKKYCDNANDLLIKYKKNKEYKYEIDFDLQNFFPSINPRILYNYMIELLPVYYSDKNMITLTTIVEKLIFLKVTNLDTKDDIDTAKYYYKSYKPKKNDFALGIAQGLPHSYFFANLFMIEVKEIYEKQFDKSKMLFYVDDSIIYTTGKDSFNKKELFEKKYSSKNNDLITKINYEIKEKIGEYNKLIESLKEYAIDDEFIDKFLNKNEDSFTIQLHPFAIDEIENSKSSITEIDNVIDFGGFLARQTSNFAGSMTKLFDDDSDKIMYEKSKLFLNLIEKELEKYQKFDDDKGESYDSEKYKKYLGYQKFFKNRAKTLSLTINGDMSKIIEVITKQLQSINKIEKPRNFAEKFFQAYTENTLITDILSVVSAKFRYNINIDEIQKNLSEINERLFMFDNQKSSYISKILSLIESSKEINAAYNNRVRYDTLETIVGYKLGISYNKNKKTKTRILNNEITTFFNGNHSIDLEYSENTYNKSIIGYNNNLKRAQNSITKNKTFFIDSYFNIYFKSNSDCFSKIANLVLVNSYELYRMLFNAIVSYLSQIDISDSFSINKNDNILIHYYELRLLIFLRNRKFDLEKFERHYKDCMNNEYNREIDYSVLQVLKIFSKYVKNPEQIDILILTHKYISDIWKNGSKQLYFYTLHNQDHAIELIKNSIKLTKVIDYLQIKPIDYYILFLSCYLHDISMVTIPNYDSLQSNNKETNKIYSDFIGEKIENLLFEEPQGVKKKLKEYYLRIDKYYENLVRDNHGKDSAKEILERSTLSFIDLPIKMLVSKVSLAHASLDADIYGSKSLATENVISLKYLKILLRLADLLDMGSNRVTDLLLTHNLENMNEITRFHWLSHSITKGYKIKNNYEIIKKGKDVLFSHHKIRETITITIYVDLLQFTPMKYSYNCCKMHLMTPTEKEKKEKKEQKEKECSSFIYESDGYVEKEEELSFNGDLFDRNIELKINNKLQCKSCKGKCNFLCNWIVIKNKYLFDELFALQAYLQSLPNNLFLTEFYVQVRLINKEVLNNNEFNYLKEFINKKNQEEYKKNK